MPEYVDQSDMSQRNPSPKMDLSALESMTPVQGVALAIDLINALHEKLQLVDNRLKYLERYETNPMPPVRTVVGDSEFIAVTQTEEHALVAFDDESFRASLPQPLFPTYLDKYRHCTEPETFPDIYLSSGIADVNIDPDGTLVIKIVFANGSENCYYVWERNVIGELTDYVSLEKVVDCSECEYVPPTDPPCPNPPCVDPPGDYPVYNGFVVTDINCEKDEAGDLIVYVTFTNLLTGEKKTETRLDCCCDTAPSPYTLHRWRPCAAEDYDYDGDIFLPQSIYDNADSADPVIQIEEDGTCYRFVEEVTGEVQTAFTTIIYSNTCEDLNCIVWTTVPVPASCPDDAPARLRIANYAITYFGDVRIYTNACNDPDSTAGDPVWDGTMPNLTGACTWGNDSSVYKDADLALKWQIASQVTLVGGTRWELVLQFTRDTNLSGVPAPYAQVRYDKVVGDSPEGTYVRSTGAPQFTTIGCYVVRDTIIVEAY